MKKRFVLSLLTASCLALTACDNHPYKEELQRIYDYNNPTGNQAVCMVVGEIPYSSYPYTNFHMEREDLLYEAFESKPPDYYIPYYHRLENEALHFFSKAGLLTEQAAGEDKGKPIYTYDLTELGKKHFSGFRNQTNFCFGRVVVDSFDGTKDGINGVGGGKIRHVYITYHVENIPEWVKTSKAYDLYSYPEEVVTGEKLKGDNYYDVFSDGRVKFKNSGTVLIGYQWATRSDDKDYPFKEELDKKDVEEKEAE